MQATAHSRSEQRNSARGGSLFYAVQQLTVVSTQCTLGLRRSRSVSTSYFLLNFNGLSDLDCLMQFLFQKEEIFRMIPVVAWPERVTHAARNGYGISPILAICILLKIIATACRWHDLELLFGKHASHF